MTEWIHCNSCCVQPSPSIKFFLTNCGHVFCALCVEKSTRPACYVCKNACNIIPLSSKMDQTVLTFFQNPKDIVKRHKQELLKVVEFQSGHRKRLMKKAQEKEERTKAIYEDFKKATSYIQHLERKKNLLFQENMHLKRLNTSTVIPAEHGHTPRNPMSQLQNGSPCSQSSEGVLSGIKVPSPYPNLLARNSYPHPPPPPPATRLTIRTPPSGGRMGSILGSNSSTLARSECFYTPPSTNNTPYRGYSRSPQDSIFSNGIQSIGLPHRNQNKIPDSNRSLSGSSSGGSARTPKAIVSPYSPDIT